MLVHAETELVLEPNGSQQPQRIVAEDRLGHGTDDPRLEIPTPAVRIVHVVTPDPNGDRVEREVARRQIRVDPARERCEVDGLLGSFHDDAPGSMALGERERRAAEASSRSGSRLPSARGRRRRRRARVARAGDRGSRHRRSTPPRRRESRRSGRRSSRVTRFARVEPVSSPVAISYPIVPATRACSSIRIPSPTSVTGVPAATSWSSSTAIASIETVPTTRRRSPSTRPPCPSGRA